MTDTYELRIFKADKWMQTIFINYEKTGFRKVDVEHIGGGESGHCIDNAENYLREYRQSLMGNAETRKHYDSLTNRYEVQGGWLREKFKAGSYIQHYWVFDKKENKHFDVTGLLFDDGVYFCDNSLYKRTKYLAINSERFGYKTYLNNIEIREHKIFLRDEYDNYKEVALTQINEKLLIQTEKQHDKFFR